MDSRHRRHLKTRLSKPFNILSKGQEDVAKIAADKVWELLLRNYPSLEFQNLKTLGRTGLSPEFCVNYLNRGFSKERPYILLKDLQSNDSADGIRPDGGAFFVKSKKDGFLHIVGTLEVKHQGEYDGYTPITDSDWKKRGRDMAILRRDRPSQAQGNAVERFAKNANAIKTLTSFYGYNPYLIFCEGFDFYLRKEYEIFSKQKYSAKFRNRDSSILMRLIAGNDWLPLNRIYGRWRIHGKSVICPATIFARMRKWSVHEIADIWLKVIDQSLQQLKSLREIDG